MVCVGIDLLRENLEEIKNIASLLIVQKIPKQIMFTRNRIQSTTSERSESFEVIIVVSETTRRKIRNRYKACVLKPFFCLSLNSVDCAMRMTDRSKCVRKSIPGSLGGLALMTSEECLRLT